VFKIKKTKLQKNAKSKKLTNEKRSEIFDTVELKNKLLKKIYREEIKEAKQKLKALKDGR